MSWLTGGISEAHGQNETQRGKQKPGKPPFPPVPLLQVPEAMFQEILPKVLKGDMNTILSSPKHLELFLLARQRVPAKLESLIGPVDLFSADNIPRFEETVSGLSLGCPALSWPLGDVYCVPLPSRLVNLLKLAASSVKKEHKLPDVALDLLRLALKENKFELFWKKVLEEGLLKGPSWTSRCV